VISADFCNPTDICLAIGSLNPQDPTAHAFTQGTVAGCAMLINFILSVNLEPNLAIFWLNQLGNIISSVNYLL